MPETTTIPPAITFSDRALDFLRAPGHHAVVATFDPDRGLHQALVWYLMDGTTIVLNSMVGRRWPSDLVRDPRISVTVSDGPEWIAVRGTVRIVEEQGAAQADIAAMAHAYESPGEAATSIARFRTQRRISFRVAPDRIHEELGE